MGEMFNALHSTSSSPGLSIHAAITNVKNTALTVLSLYSYYRSERDIVDSWLKIKVRARIQYFQLTKALLATATSPL